MAAERRLDVDAPGRGEQAAPRPGVPTIRVGRSTRGWVGETIYVRSVPETLFTTPDGIGYVRARPREQADLRIAASDGLPAMKLRRWETSAARRAMNGRGAPLTHRPEGFNGRRIR